MRKGVDVPTSRPLLSQTAEHALRAVLYLGGQDAGEWVPADRIAAALGTPPNYTAKTLRRLSRKGLLRSVRGPHGGFQLRVDPAAISLARLVDAVDERAVDASVCLLGDRPCEPAHACVAHDRWAGLQRRINDLMEQTSVADLLGSPAPRPSAAEPTLSPSEMDRS